MELRTKRAIVVCWENEFHTGKLPALSENKKLSLKTNKSSPAPYNETRHTFALNALPTWASWSIRPALFDVSNRRMKADMACPTSIRIAETRENALFRCLKPTAEILRGSFTTARLAKCPMTSMRATIAWVRIGAIWRPIAAWA